jgi:WbqC-like protein family
MKVAIMQPYFFPYIGYFQLIGSVDLFVIYDNIKYTKKGWINRNRILRNGVDCVFTVPLRKDSDSLDVKDRAVAADFDRGRLVNQLREAYRRAPHFQEGFAVVEKAVMAPRDNLFEYVHGSVVEVCRYLGIGTRIVPSSSFAIDPVLKAQDKVLALCKAASASMYVNAVGGQELYNREEFRARRIELKFLKTGPIEYPQFGDPFVPWLSIIDVMMFNPVARIREFLETRYELI